MFSFAGFLLGLWGLELKTERKVKSVKGANADEGL